MDESKREAPVATRLAATLAVAVATAVGYRRRSARDVCEGACVSRASPLGHALATSAVHERVLLVYLVGLLVAVLGGDGPGRPRAAAILVAGIGIYLAGLLVVRTLPAPGWTKGVVARGLVMFALLYSFLELHVILPAARGARACDASLLAFDLRVFRFEPAVAWDRFVTPATTEWFSFFYFGYFLLLALHIVPMFLVERRAAVVGGFARGMALVYAVGQLVYTIVPGFGPYQHLSFVHALPHGFWWDLVQHSVGTVDETSRTDIFPSLHTAAPLFLTLFAWQNRKLAPFHLLWPPLAFVTSQIILATMFLRWHYLCDVLAGMLLAVGAARFARLQAGEDEARAQKGWTPVIPPLVSEVPCVADGEAPEAASLPARGDVTGTRRRRSPSA